MRRRVGASEQHADGLDRCIVVGGRRMCRKGVRLDLVHTPHASCTFPFFLF